MNLKAQILIVSVPHIYRLCGLHVPTTAMDVKLVAVVALDATDVA